MTTTTSEPLRVVYLAKLARFTDLDVFGKKTERIEPTGDLHIFELVMCKDGEVRAARSLCGKSGSEIG